MQFGLVPFAASVNVGSQYANASWMDTEGVSPVHHENFDWTTMNSGSRRVEPVGAIYVKQGEDWGEEEGETVTRFTLFDELDYVSDRECERHDNWGNCTEWEATDWSSYTNWKGCVEMRPHPYGLDDTPPAHGSPETLFVPMFAPDETDNGTHMGDWWPDGTGGGDAHRQGYMPKYFESGPYGTSPAFGMDEGPNGSCTTSAITPLTDVSTAGGLATVKDAIDDMYALGGTAVPDGMAWGWRVVSSPEPFTGGRSENERGNDKVVIVLTDGANTYYTPGSLGYHDRADNRSIYSNYGYARNGRIFEGTSGGSSYSIASYTRAMNQHMDRLCEDAKAGNIVVMTVALDLSTRNSTERGQIDAMEACASESRFRKDADGNPGKLFWNTTGADLDETFEQIADELSNLRIVG